MKTLTLDEYAALPELDDSYLIDRFIPAQGRILLIGPPKKGKSFLALQYGLAVAKGEDFIHRHSTPGKVLYLQYDTPHALWLDRIKKLKSANVMFHDNFVMLDPRHPHYQSQIDIRKNEADRLYLMEIVDTVKPQLVIIDTLRKIFSGDENSSDVCAEVFNHINEIFKKQAVVYVHHTHKLSPPPGQKIQHKIAPVDAARGSSFISGEVDAIHLLYGKHLSIESRFDEEAEYTVERDPITKLWTFPDGARLSKMEENVRRAYLAQSWPSWQAFREYAVHQIIDVPDFIMQRLEVEFSTVDTDSESQREVTQESLDYPVDTSLT